MFIKKKKDVVVNNKEDFLDLRSVGLIGEG